MKKLLMILTIPLFIACNDETCLKCTNIDYMQGTRECVFEEVTLCIGESRGNICWPGINSPTPPISKEQLDNVEKLWVKEGAICNWL